MERRRKQSNKGKSEMIELLDIDNIQNIGNSIFSIKNLSIIVPFLVLSFFVIKKVKDYPCTIIGVMFGFVVLPFSGGIFALINYNTIFIVLLILIITFLLYRLKFPSYKLLIYPSSIFIVLLLIMYVHFIIPIILGSAQSILVFYLFSAFIYSILYGIIGFFIDKKALLTNTRSTIVSLAAETIAHDKH